MAADSKLIQRGMNAQDNDLALPAGTPIYALNAEFSRSGVAERRRGFESFWDGIPKGAIEDFQHNGKFHNLFSGQHLFTDTNGMMFTYDEVNNINGTPSNEWKSVPFDFPHNFKMLGSAFPNGSTKEVFSTIGRMVVLKTPGYAFDLDGLFSNWQGDFASSVAGAGVNCFTGTIANDAANAGTGGVTAGTETNARYRTPFDVATTSSGTYVSDDWSIRQVNASVTILAGSLTATGSVNGTGTAATFSGASWMAAVSADLFVADNSNQIRKITTPGGVVTTFAGSVTAGDVDGVGTSARFRNISGMCALSGFLYVAEGAGAHRIRKVDVTTGSVTIYAGSLTPTSGYVNATGTAARFNTPTGIETDGSGNFYIGDSGNSSIRKLTLGAVVTTLSGSPTSSPYETNMVGGAVATAILPGVVVRGVVTSSTVNGGSSKPYMSIECTAPNNSTDLGLVSVDPSDTSNQYVYHYGRCPNSLPTQTTGPTKLDSAGFNAYSKQNVRSADVNGGIVFTTSDKPRVMDVYNRLNYYDSVPRLRPLGIEAPEAPSVTVVTSGTLPFAASTTVAYRALAGLKLSDGRIVLGPASPRVIQSSAVAWSGSVTVYPAPGLPYDGMTFVQLYRTRSADIASDPGDQMFLCYETPLSYGSGVIISDIMSDSLLGAELSTNATQDGAAFTPLPPPTFCNEVASFNNSAVLANYNDRAFVRVQMLGVTGLVNGTSTITFTTTGPNPGVPCTSFRIWAAAAENANVHQFANVVSGSAGTNAVNTAKSIVRVINRCPDAQLFYAIYDESDPGAFYVYSWHPGRTAYATANIIVDSLATVSGVSNVQSAVTFSTNTTVNFVTTGQQPSIRQLNALAYSEQFDSDAWPAVQQQTLSASQEQILRLLPLAETLIAVKDSSIWRYDSSFTEQIYDPSVQCSWPDSFARLTNNWIGMFTRGFLSLGASSAKDIGHPIDRLTLPYAIKPTSQTTALVGQGTSIETRSLYLCSIGNAAVSANGWRSFAYNSDSSAWSEWVVDTLAGENTNGIGIPGNYQGAIVANLGAPLSGEPQSVMRQRDYRRATNSYDFDFADAGIAATAAALSGSVTVTATLTGSTLPFTTTAGNPIAATLAGGYLVCGTMTAIVQSAAFVGTAATFTLAASVTAIPSSALTFYMPISFGLLYAPVYAPANAAFGDVVVTTERVRGGSVTAYFFDRKDAAQALTVPFVLAPKAATNIGPYEPSAGKSRTNVMTENLIASGANAYLLHDVQRFATPSERATDQVLIVGIYERKAVAPLAIKSTRIEYDSMDKGKVKQ